MGATIFDNSIPFSDRVRTFSHIAILLTLGVLAMIYLQGVIQPFILALFVFLLLRPGAEWLKQHNVPTILAYFLVIFGLVSVVILTGWLLYEDLSKVIDTLPEQMVKIDSLLANLQGMTILGMELKLHGASDQLTGDSIRNALFSVFGNAASFLTNLITVIVFLLFIILEAETLPGRIRAAYPSDVTGKLHEMSKQIGEGINRYVLVKTFVSFGTAFVTGAILVSVGVPGWFMWSVLTFLLNYVPYIGSLFAVFPPVSLAFLTLNPAVAIVVMILLVSNQQLWGAIIEPKMFGASLDISPVVLLLMAAFWFWLWGIIGMVIAVPMAVIAKIVLGQIDGTKPFAILLSERAPKAAVDDSDE